MALTDVRVRTAKPATKPYKLTDGQGLYLLIMPSGSKLWRVKFRHLGKEKLLAVGAYPEVSLSAARKARDHARELLAKGNDPSLTKRREKVRKLAEAKDTFAAVANELLEKFETGRHGSRHHQQEAMAAFFAVRLKQHGRRRHRAR